MSHCVVPRLDKRQWLLRGIVKILEHSVEDLHDVYPSFAPPLYCLQSWPSFSGHTERAGHSCCRQMPPGLLLAHRRAVLASVGLGVAYEI